MKNKNILIFTMIKSTFIVLVLFYFLSCNSGIRKMMIVPFILCGFSSIGKNLCLFMDKKKYANIFGKLFIISFLTFWFGFIIFWSYLVIKENNYLPLLLFTIPFWIIGIYIIRRFLLGTKSKSISPRKKSKFNFPIIVSCFLVVSVLLIGIFCLFFGIKDTHKLNKITENYITVDGFFTDYEIYSTSKNNNSITYKLIYTYTVDEKKYTVSTDYGVGFIPEKNNVRKVKYNPNNPNESILVGNNSKNFLIYFGIFFTLGSIAFILGALSIKGIFNKLKIDIVGLYLGIFLCVTGIGIILFQNGTTSSLIEIIKSLGLWIVIPILFIIVGIFLIIKCLFLNRLMSNKKIN